MPLVCLVGLGFVFAVVRMGVVLMMCLLCMLLSVGVLVVLVVLVLAFWLISCLREVVGGVVFFRLLLDVFCLFYC